MDCFSLFQSTFLGIFLLCSLFYLKTMVVISIGSLNINGGRDVGKRFLISDLINRKRLNVTFLQETHTDGSNELEWGVWWRGDHVLSHGTNVSAGLAILFAQDLDIKIQTKTEIVPGRFLIVSADINNHAFVFINLYDPNAGTERVRLFEKLDEEIGKISQEKTIVLGGDFNCTVNFTKDRNGEEPHLGSARVLDGILKKNNLKDVWRDKHPTDSDVTFRAEASMRVSSNPGNTM